MIQQSHSSEAPDIEITDLTSALMSALGMKTSEEGQKIQSVTIFLSKLYRKYCQQTGKKFNEVKLSRFNGLLYKICKDPPSENQDMELIYEMILAFINNEGNSPIDDNSYAPNTSIWIAKFIEEVVAVKLPEVAISIMEIVLKNKKPILITPEEYDKKIEASLYFKDKEITKNDQVGANKKCIYKGFMSQYSVYDEIKSNLNVQRLFENIYTGHPKKTEAMKLYLMYCRETDVSEMKDIFVKVFVQNRVQDKQTLYMILHCLDSEFFTAQDYNEIIKLLLAKNQRKIFYSLPIKGHKNQNRYLEILADQCKGNVIDEMAEIFTNEQEANNYYLLYLIHKSSQKLSEKYLILPTNKPVTNRQAIICAICISHNLQIAHSRILKYFFDHEDGLSSKQKFDYLKIAHFSYLNAPKSHLFTSVIKAIPYTLLDKEADFQFLPREGYEKIQLDKSQREELNDFLSRYFGNSDDVYWIKLDLYIICGKELACMQDFKRVQKIFEAPIDQIVQDLPNIPQSLLEVVLMGVNNKLTDQFVVNQATVGHVVQWALDLYRKQYKKFRASSQIFLKRTNNPNLLELCLDLFDFNLDQKTQMQFEDEFKIITSAQNSRKLNGLQFSEYFMGSQGEENEMVNSVIKNKNLVIELQKLIKNLSNDSKTQNRKELKTLVSEEASPLRALKIIKSLSATAYEKNKNPEKLQALVQTLLSYVKPEYQNFKQLSQRANNVNIPYVPVFQSLQFLLSVSYEKTLNFLVSLLKSKPAKSDQKSQKTKKGNKKKAEQTNEKNLEVIIDNIEHFFKGDPNLLSSYNPIISIIEQIESASHNETLSEEITKWVARIKIFHKEVYKEWKDKVFNYVKLWEAISGIIADTIPVKEIERHFLIMIDLLNTLYQKHKQQKDLLVVEKRLLTGLYTLYNMAENSKKDEMQQQIEAHIPREKINEVIANYELGQVATPHIYYCYDCSKKTCHECATIIHKNHDKNYVGQGNQNECHRYGTKHKESDKSKLAKEKYIQKLIKQGGGLESIERERQKYLIISQAAERLPPEQFARFKQQKLSMFRRNQRLSTLMAQQSQQADLDQQKKKENDDDSDKIQIRSCSQKEFAIKNPSFISESSKPKPIFQSQQYPRRNRPWKLNLTPLFNLLVRQLKSNSFFSSQQSQNDQKNIASLFEAQISNEKYTIVKVDYFKSNVPRISTTYLANQQQHPNAFSITKRNVITMNEKFLGVLSGGFASQVHYLDTNTIRTRFLKKQSEKRYRQNDTLQTYQLSQNKINEQSILQIVISPFAHNLIASISAHKILFQQISRESRSRLICLEQSNSQEILKFQWMRASGLKSFYAYLTSDLIIGKIGKKDIQLKQRISLGDKKVKDFSNCAFNSKIIMMTLLDTQGKLYRCKLDLYNNKKPPNFQDYKITLSNVDPISSIFTFSNWVFCTTTTGKITLLTLNQQNNLTVNPISYPIVQLLKSHKISEINMKFKQVSKIGKLRYVTKYQNDIYVSCLLMKDSIPGDYKKNGYFVIICLNIQSRKAKIVLYNDQGTTDSYDFIVVSDKEFLFICLQDDGELWACKLTAQPKNTALRANQPSLMLPLQPNELSFYAEHISRLNLFDQLQFYSKSRKKSLFKENQRISDHFKTNVTADSITFDVADKFARTQFVTGIQFGYTHNVDADGPSSRLVFQFMGNIYRFEVARTREIQIPLTIKESLTLFLSLQDFKIKFIQGKPATNVKDITIFGVKLTEKSVYFEALNSLCQMIYIYKSPKEVTNDKRLEKYFYNENQTQLKLIEPKPLEEYLVRKKFTLEEQNMVLKLELFRQSVEKYKNEGNLVYECFESIRNFILPHCQQRKQLITSVYKLCLALSQSSKDSNALKLGHSLNHQTQLDIYNAFRIYKIFRTEATVDSYQDLLAIICRILNSRTLNAFIIMSVYPDLLKQISKFFKKILSDYKLFFKTNDYGLEKDQKQKLNRICSNMMRILIQSYQLQKNKERNNPKVNCQEEVLNTLESIFCLNKKQVHREIKLNPFQYFESPFQEGQYIQKNPPINYLQVQKIDLQQPKKPIQPLPALEQRKIKVESNNSNQQPRSENSWNEGQGEGENEPGYQQSCEQHKEQEEQNREMLDEYAYQMQAEGGMNAVQKMIEQDEEQEESDHNDINVDDSPKSSEMNTKKIYEYLHSQSSAMTPQQTKFLYHGICQNILTQLYTSNSINGEHKYLENDNLVFYVGLVYNLLQIVDRKITALFGNSGVIDFGHPYIQASIVPIIDAIDSKIDSPSHSVLFLPLNSLIAANPKDKKPTQSCFIQCLKSYYQTKFATTKLSACLTCSKWFPEQCKPPASISSVLRFEYFDTVNPLYQIKYMGSLYMNMIKGPACDDILRPYEPQIKQTILKAVVRYNLRIYRNITVLKNWQNELEKTKINVAFEKLRIKPEQSLRIIIKSIGKDIRSFIEQTKQSGEERITALEELLGSSSTLDELVLEILNHYYSFDQQQQLQQEQEKKDRKEKGKDESKMEENELQQDFGPIL